MANKTTAALVVVLGVVLIGSAAMAVQGLNRLGILEDRVARLELDRAPRAEREPPARVARGANERDGNIDVDTDFFARRRVAAGKSDPVAPPPPAVGEPQEGVQALVRSELQRVEAEREDERESRRRQRTSERVQAFAIAQKLTPEQQESIANLVVAEQQEIGQLFRDARENDAWEGVRDQVRELRKATDDNAKALLAPEQMEAFAALRDEEAQRFRRRFGTDSPDAGTSAVPR